MKNDFDRLYTVNIFKNIDYNRAKELQEIVSLAASICETPVALITLLDDNTNHFVAKFGLDVSHMPAQTSFCRHTIEELDGTLVINDTLQDERFINNPHVTAPEGVRFYAGSAIHVNTGHKIGSLCVIDIKPKELTAIQLKTLEVLSRQATILMEYELSKKLLKEQLEDIEKQNQMLMNISKVQSHEFRGPVASLLGIMNMIKDDDYVASKEYLQLMENAINTLDERIHLIVEYTRLL